MQHKGMRFDQLENILQGLKRSILTDYAIAYIPYDEVFAILVSGTVQYN